MLDVVKRYDVDGIHMDDYFYPYQVTDANKKTVDFPDSASYAKYRALGGKLARDDWRRKNINTFVSTLYKEVKKEKPWVKVGISPFGIWRPGYPAVIQGLDPYTTLFADSRQWPRNGWVDLFTPQLYRAVSRPHQSYSVLLKWWAEQNVKGRNLWPGNNFSLGEEEIARQIAITRNQPGATGNIFFDASNLMRNSKGVADALGAAYARPALMPASPWLDAIPPAAPTLHLGLRFGSAGNTLTASWTGNGTEAAWQWLVRSKIGGTWRTDILPFEAGTVDLPAGAADGDVVTVCAVDRCGNVSAPASATVSGAMTAAM
jgi:uncharacterized lipoprotein YddW (UPF0748 family)